jgi:hypothetical protein
MPSSLSSGLHNDHRHTSPLLHLLLCMLLGSCKVLLHPCNLLLHPGQQCILYGPALLPGHRW